MEALKDDIVRLEHQISDIKGEMLHDQEEVLRLQARLNEAEANVGRLRGHLDRLWVLRVTQHERETPSASVEVAKERGTASVGGPEAGLPRSTVAGLPSVQGDLAAVDDALPPPVPSHPASPSTDECSDPPEHPGALRSYIPPANGAAGELAAFLATLKPRRKDFSNMERRSDGMAPDGFAHAVREIAHRSIARAGRPLDRNAIFGELKASGVTFPDANPKLKVSKILTRDPDLKNIRGSGYFLNLRGLKKQLWEIRAEIETGKGEMLPSEFWGRWDKDGVTSPP